MDPKIIFLKILRLLVGKIKLNRNLRKTISLYRGNRFMDLFTELRIWDAPYERVEKLVPKTGIILDLGCGDGLFANYLAVSSPERKIIGIDMNKNRISLADKGLANTGFIRGDATKVKLLKADAIVMYHLLHHLGSFGQQADLLEKAGRMLKKNGSLIIVEIDQKFSFKFLITWITDHFIYPVLFDKKFYEGDIFYRNKRRWMDLLAGMGYKSRVLTVEEGKPFTHIVFICRK